MAKKKKKSWNQMKAEKSARRKAHFENGGTLAMWRGAARTFKDKKKAMDRRACRGRVEI
tara:strand:- start:168 stop:344 length:177 start_codon:yes stop_codon:yes gene_type:complete